MRYGGRVLRGRRLRREMEKKRHVSPDLDRVRGRRQLHSHTEPRLARGKYGGGERCTFGSLTSCCYPFPCLLLRYPSLHLSSTSSRLLPELHLDSPPSLLLLLLQLHLWVLTMISHLSLLPPQLHPCLPASLGAALALSGCCRRCKYQASEEDQKPCFRPHPSLQYLGTLLAFR